VWHEPCMGLKKACPMSEGGSHGTQGSRFNQGTLHKHTLTHSLIPSKTTNTSGLPTYTHTTKQIQTKKRTRHLTVINATQYTFIHTQYMELATQK
jgi:hypothetical protein